MSAFLSFLLLFGAILGDQLEVLEPMSLWKKAVSRDGKRGFISTSRSKFGNPKLNVGRTVRVVLPQTGNEHCCQPILLSTELEPSESFVILAKRGMCSFGQKAKIAEKAGAIAVIVSSDLQLKPTLDILPILTPNGEFISHCSSNSNDLDNKP